MNLDEPSDSFCGKKTFFFIVPPKNTLTELITVIVVALLYGFFATYLAHPKTAALSLDVDEDEESTCSVLAIICVLFSSYSLIS